MKFSYGATPRGHYTPAVISRGMVYISGQTSLDGATGLPAAGGVEAEAMFALRKLDPINKAYAAYFGDHKPARVALPVKELNKGCRVEIEAIAELPEA